MRKKPKEPVDPRKVAKQAAPIAVRTYFKGNKRVKGYKRRRAGDGNSDDK